MTGILQNQLQALQQYRPFIEGIVVGILTIIVLLFCFSSILQTPRKRDDYNKIDDEYCHAFTKMIDEPSAEKCKIEKLDLFRYAYSPDYHSSIAMIEDAINTIIDHLNKEAK